MRPMDRKRPTAVGDTSNFRRAPEDVADNEQASPVSLATTRSGRGRSPGDQRCRQRAHSAPEAVLLNTGHAQGDYVPNFISARGYCIPPPPPPPPPILICKGPANNSGSTSLLQGEGGGSPLPAIRSMHNGLARTGIVQNTVRLEQCADAGDGVAVRTGRGGGGGGLKGPRRPAAPSRSRQFAVQSRRANLEMKCCRINVLLVIMQVSLGTVVTALGFYMQTLSPSLDARECPFWAGIPLLLAGVVGIFFCATDFISYTRSLNAFVVKCVCLVLSSPCVFVCMIGSVFPGIHGSRISSYAECTVKLGRHCQCVLSLDPGARVYEYRDVKTCDLVKTSVKDYLILQCALNAIASGVCFWFVTLLWKSRYQDVYPGMRFQSYAGGPHAQPHA